MSLDSDAGAWSGLCKIAPAISRMITEALIGLQASLECHPVIRSICFTQIVNHRRTAVCNYNRIQCSTYQIYLWNLYRRNSRMFLIKLNWCFVCRSTTCRITAVGQIGINLDSIRTAICICGKNNFSQCFSLSISCFCLKYIGNRG